MSVHLEQDSDVNNINDRVIGQTKGGKKIVAFQDFTGYIKVKFTKGGQLPPVLAGKWTSYEYAEQAVLDYLADEGKAAKEQALRKARLQKQEEERLALEQEKKAEEDRLLAEMEGRAKQSTASQRKAS